MDKLEKDQLFVLATQLSLPDLLNFCRSSKKINSLVCKRDNIWVYKLSKEYSNWKEFNFDKTKSLKEIYISLYQLQILRQKLNLDYSLLELYNLKELDLSHNKIPKEIEQLYNLKKLWLTYDQMKHLPKEIKQLQLNNLQTYGINPFMYIQKTINTKVY